MHRHLSKVVNWKSVAVAASFRPARMAAFCSVSLRELERFFHEEFEKTPRDWIREVRCKEARKLVEKGWTCKATAAELRFANQSHLCHQFKKVFGRPPRAFIPVKAGRRKA